MTDVLERTAKMLPERARVMLGPIRSRLIGKTGAELDFWKSKLEDEGQFENSHFERLMLGMAGEPNVDFLADKVVADFGCGPRGSLVWASPARIRIGIDVLADRYAEEFTSDVLSHGMIYLKSTEHVIPLPSDLLDVMFTMNAIDHVDHFSEMCHEIVRVIKPGGVFIGSFNLEEPASRTEPQRLNEAVIKESLLDYLIVQSYRATGKPRQLSPAPGDGYEPFFEEGLSYTRGEEGILWVRAMKPSL
ncbi:MAG: methyltransferase domain-containing protein [Gaiellaceae bacterium]